MPEKGKCWWSHSKKECAFHGNREKDKMNKQTAFIETFIFDMQVRHYNETLLIPIKVVINFSCRLYTVYAKNGRVLLKVERLSSKELCDVKKQLDKYIESKKPKRYSIGEWGPAI